MPLSLNEIKDRALAFSRNWEGTPSERAEAQTFWNEFFNVFGVTRRRFASFEEYVKPARARYEKSGDKGGFIDLFWRGTLMVEHKSPGRVISTLHINRLWSILKDSQSVIFLVTLSFLILHVSGFMILMQAPAMNFL